MIDLSLIPLQDIIKELDSRFEHWIFSGIQTHIGKDNNVFTVRKWNGNSATCSGLASMIQITIFNNHMDGNELKDGEEEI